MGVRRVFGIAVLLALALPPAVAATAAAVPQSTVKAILADAQDNGRLDGDWTQAQVKAALQYVESSWLQQYSDIEAVLASYSPESSQPGTATLNGNDLDAAYAAADASASSSSGKDSGGYLARTGGTAAIALSAGAALAGAGIILRRRK